MWTKAVAASTVALCVAVGASAFAQNAKGPDAGQTGVFPVIVVFDATAPLDAFARDAHADARFNANPAAWDYLDRGVVGAVQALEARYGFAADHVYGSALHGFSAQLTARQIQDLENNPLVDYVEADGTATINAKPGAPTVEAQTLPWGIDRVDADLSLTVAGDGGGAVSGVNVYIIDTGIDYNHTDLNASSARHVNFTGSKQNYDCHGHGTHVSGTAAAKDNTQDVVGVAPGATLYGVKVLNCAGSGSWSGVIKGIDWVTANHSGPSVANMSLGGGANTSVDNAVKNSALSGVFYAIAAGNSGADACNSSPARAGTAHGVMTVAATDPNDKETSWSNYGDCVDIWAPGLNILSTKKGGGTTTMSGTSMATPHVTGAGALYLSGQAATPVEVEAALKRDAVETLNTTSKDGTAVTLLNVAGY